jgi:hypothetical protein
VPNIDVSSLSDGTLTYSVTLTDAAGNVGSAVTTTAVLDKAAPTRFLITVSPTTIDLNTATAISITFSGAEIGTTYDLLITTDGGSETVTKSGTIDSAAQVISGIDVSSMSEGTLTFSMKLTDAAGNVGIAVPVTATLSKTTTPEQSLTDSALAQTENWLWY